MTMSDAGRWAPTSDVYATPERRQRGLRTLFLMVLGDEAPEVVRSLWALAPVSVDVSDDALRAWAASHHLDVDWMLQAAREARAFWRAYRRQDAEPPTYWPVQDNDEDRGCWMGDVWLTDEQRARLDTSDHRHPSRMTAADALHSLDYFSPLPTEAETPATFGKRRRAYDAARRAAFAAHGDSGEQRRAKVEPGYLRWVARHVVLGQSYRRIAEDLAKRRPADLRSASDLEDDHKFQAALDADSLIDQVEARWRDVKRAVRPLRAALPL